MSTVVTFCNCTGAHKPDCQLGRRLKIKYHPAIQKVWDVAGPEETEQLIDTITGLKI